MTGSPNLQSILALARAGATARAWEAFVASGFDGIANDPRVLTLKGRLLKDRARKANHQSAARLFLQSAKAYADAAALRPDSYPLINAAAMSLFAGQADHMRLLAQRVLSLLQSGGGVGETPYWHDATRAEALLLLGQRNDAEAALANAIEHAPKAWEDHATTLRQFREIAAALGLSTEWLGQFAPPPVLHFGGMMGIAHDDGLARDQIAHAVHESGAGFGYGAIAAGADILIAEALMEAGGELHLVLPAMPSQFKSISVDAFGDEWSPRFERLFEQAASVEIIDHAGPVSTGSIAAASLIAKGMALDKAQRMETRFLAMQVGDGRQVQADADIRLALPRTAASDETQPLAESVMELLVIEGRDGTGMLQPAAAFAQSRGGAFDEASAAHLVIKPDGAEVAEAENARVVRMVQSAQDGALVASKHAAMALKALQPGLRVEAIGELPDTGGAIAMFTISPSANHRGPIAASTVLA